MLHYLKFLILFLVTYRCHGANFVALGNEEILYEPCNNFLNVADDILETNIKFKYADDMETLIADGNITFNADIPKLAMSFELFLWNRANWEQTIYLLKREDLCSVLFDPTEIWYPVTKNAVIEDDNCPPKKGTVVHINNMEHRIELNNLHIMQLEGKYKVVTKFFADDRLFFCLENTLDIWKN